MNLHNRILVVCLLVSLFSISVFAQENDRKKGATQTKAEEAEEENDPKSTGLRKIASGSGLRDLEMDINIDEDALEADIEVAVEDAMRTVEYTLENLDIHIEPINFDFSGFDFHMGPIDIDIPDMDFDIDPIDIDMDDIDIDIDKDDFNWNDNDNDNDNDNWNDNEDDDGEDSNPSFDDDKEKDKVKDKVKDKANKMKEKSDKDDKAKGLKKLN